MFYQFSFKMFEISKIVCLQIKWVDSLVITEIAHCYESYVFISVAYCWFWETKTMLLFSHKYNQYWICFYFTYNIVMIHLLINFLYIQLQAVLNTRRNSNFSCLFLFPTMYQDNSVITLGILSERKSSELKFPT